MLNTVLHFYYSGNQYEVFVRPIRYRCKICRKIKTTVHDLEVFKIDPQRGYTHEYELLICRACLAYALDHQESFTDRKLEIRTLYEVCKRFNKKCEKCKHRFICWT